MSQCPPERFTASPLNNNPKLGKEVCYENRKDITCRIDRRSCRTRLLLVVRPRLWGVPSAGPDLEH